MTSTSTGPLTRLEMRALLAHTLEHAEEPLTTEELERIVGWAEDARVAAAMLGLALEGRMSIRWPEGAEEPMFRRHGEPRL